MRVTGYRLPAVRNPSLYKRYQPPVTNSGFTLLELIVVIFIVSMILAVSLPSFTGLGASRLRSDSKKAASILRYLNDTAITTKDSLDLKVNLKDKTLYYKGPEGEKKEKLETLGGISLQSKGLVSEGEVIVFFNQSGVSENINIHLKDDKSSTTVELNSASGRVRITDETENEKQ